MKKKIRYALLIAPLFIGAAVAQDLGIGTLTGTNDMNIDRFGKPVFGLRAQREPELRRLRAQAGRLILHGRVDIFDLSAEELETLANNRRRSKSPAISCDEVDGKIVCTAN